MVVVLFCVVLCCSISVKYKYVCFILTYECIALRVIYKCFFCVIHRIIICLSHIFRLGSFELISCYIADPSRWVSLLSVELTALH